MSYPLSQAGHPPVIDLRTRTRTRPRRGRFRFKIRAGRLLVTAFLLYGVYVFAAQEIRVHGLKVQEAQIQAQIRELQQTNESLREQIKTAQTDAYVEKVAREQLGLVKDGEIPYYNGVPGDPGQVRNGPGY